MSDWKEVNIGDEVMWDRKEPIEGTLVSVKAEVGPNESMLYTIKTEKGNVGVWGSTVLDTKLGQLATGSLIRIEPLGEVVSEKTKRKYQDFKVLFKEPVFSEVESQEHPQEPKDTKEVVDDIFGDTEEVPPPSFEG